MRKKTVSISIAALIAALMCFFMLSGCGGGGAAQTESDEDLIRADIEKTIGGSEIDPASVLAGMKENPEAMETLEKAGIDPNEFATAIAKLTSVETKSVEVDGDTATAVITVKMPDFTAMETMMNTEIQNLQTTTDVSKLTEDEAYKMIGEIIMKVVTDPTLPQAENDFDVTYAKQDGKWVLQDDAGLQAAMEQATGVL